MSEHTFYPLAVVAALKQCIVDTYGAEVLTPQFRRQRIAPGTAPFYEAVPQEWVWPPKGDPDPWTKEVDLDLVELTRYAWSEAGRRYDIWLGVAPRAKVLYWGTRGDDAH